MAQYAEELRLAIIEEERGAVLDYNHQHGLSKLAIDQVVEAINALFSDRFLEPKKVSVSVHLGRSSLAMKSVTKIIGASIGRSRTVYWIRTAQLLNNILDRVLYHSMPYFFIALPIP